MDDETKGAEMSVKRKKQLMTSLDEIFIKIGMLQLYTSSSFAPTTPQNAIMISKTINFVLNGLFHLHYWWRQ